jgi:hypothetical protein
MSDTTVHRAVLTSAQMGDILRTVPDRASISRKTRTKTMRSLCWSAECPFAHVYDGHQLRFLRREVSQFRSALCLATQTNPSLPTI